MTTVTLPRLLWGDPESHRRALLVHGLGSSAHTTWRLGEALAERGWSATAVDLRGHGEAPRASRYRIADFAADLSATLPDAAPGWHLVVGHSIGAAAAVVAAADDAAWAGRLVLLDPALTVDAAQRARTLDGQTNAHLHATVESTRAENPSWHPLDVELRVRATRAASLHALQHAVLDNPDWDVAARVAELACPTLVIAADPTMSDFFRGDFAEQVRASNSLVEQVVIDGAGHSVHRDAPQATIAALDDWLART
ncbi:MAG: alpha/beta hydrolase [Microcella sp.]|uniref:alpha/beta fold hydrolase n=1 Tax=Microcella sp. TaxID=1913979 RepID=UPI0024CD5F67|nr:alpha/beta hydrolase [Microcella sp.]UYN83580.1 MAG: alpha/beta hydrolase [Microcella sp.]